MIYILRLIPCVLALCIYIMVSILFLLYPIIYLLIFAKPLNPNDISFTVFTKEYHKRFLGLVIDFIKKGKTS